MTVPALISKHEKHIIETGLKKTYSELQNVIKMSEANNGDYTEWDFSDYTKFMNTYILPYLDLKLCTGKMHCFTATDNFFIWRYLSTENMNPLNTTLIPGNYRVAKKYLAKDGRSFAFDVMKAKYTNADNAYHNYVNIVVDVNGPRGKSVMGKDVFAFSLQYSDPGSSRYGKRQGFHTGTVDHFYNTDSTLYSTCGEKTGVQQGYGCSVILERNGWKFPKDYPIKF